ncbi:hypothetical protein HHK36_010696 [Tetracentron sinense]|uniref:Leucine-rich repeat-containing N-terminal plant-type domain-containing protein n=1 Tax=Tetracentron sinense TaxID=13715 RepID=A0A834ZHB5_TETSI|nr:hypothetical protein HHK36_010696 [Tetracentron sinense]
MRFLLLPWLFFLSLHQSFISFSNISVHSLCLNDQSSLLLQLKESLSYNNSTSLKLVSWNSSTDCCKWKGVTCDGSGALVTGLDLSSESITGGINNSSRLFDLGYLQSLNLANNNFNSTRIPSGFGGLGNLTYLNLSNSNFGAQIPIEISRLIRLVNLDLSSHFPGFLSLKLEDPDLKTLVRNLSSLIELRLDGVNISAHGGEWCQALSSALPNLKVLSLSSCYLSGPLDSSLLKLNSLSEIRLDLNNISAEVPEFFANFSSLTSLHLSSCALNGEFPERIFQLPNLQILDMSINQNLKGFLPKFPRNGSLHTLLLDETNFTGELPDSIGNLKLLSKLKLVGCSFHGSIPSSIANLTQLVLFDFSSNNLSGPIPPLGFSENLTQIILAHNRFTGPIPSSHWDRLVNLVNLDFRNNSLNGTIPSALFTLPSLQKLQLAHNQLTDQLPDFSNLSSPLLDTLDLSSNKLKGPIPKAVFELGGLKILTLSSNNFSGTLQLSMIQQLGNLSSLDLSYNSLSINTTGSNSVLSSFPQIGTLKLASCNLSVFPDFLREQSKLSFLDLSNNQIHGSIPKWIWNIGNGSLAYLNLSRNLLEDLERPLPDLSSSLLAILDLHNNLLQGPITLLPPSSIVLDYSNNNFTSVIPSNIDKYLVFTIFFSLSGNKLRGEIPKSICNANYLQVLDLSNNSLSGLVPPCLADMSVTLGILNLRWNNLNGTIPRTFPDGCSLRTLDLNKNKLEGQVPRALANCTRLKVLDLGNNQINDTFPFWLQSLSLLQVLVLRSNRFHGSIEQHSETNQTFHGSIGHPENNHTFPALQIVDLSSNYFTGSLPSECFSRWQRMRISKDEALPKFKHWIIKFRFLELSQLYYQDAVTVTSKGLEMELVKILTVFVSIDFSSNRFEGEIPEVIGTLESLYVLNLSHNALTGRIPSSLGNLKQLESLDLSQNKLNGEIPQQLESLTFLSSLNLSNNRLEGKIPQANQFQTFSEASFEGNIGLCGRPLATNCTGAEVASSSPPTFEETGSKSMIEFDWKFIWTGLGFGGGVGMVIGPLMFWKKGRKWYAEHIDSVILMILPSAAGLLYANCDDGRVDAEEMMEELAEIEGDFDEDEEDEEGYGGRFCVLCSKLDISRKRAIHNPNCTCHGSTPIPSSSL